MASLNRIVTKQQYRGDKNVTYHGTTYSPFAVIILATSLGLLRCSMSDASLSRTRDVIIVSGGGFRADGMLNLLCSSFNLVFLYDRDVILHND